MSSASSANFNICPMGLQLEHWISIILTAVKLFPTKTSLHIPLEGKPQRADRIKASQHLGELAGQSKRSSLTLVPHGTAVVDSRSHGIGWWNNWEVNLGKFYSPSLLSDFSLFFSSWAEAALTPGFSVIPSWKSGTWNSHATLPNVCGSLV